MFIDFLREELYILSENSWWAFNILNPGEFHRSIRTGSKEKYYASPCPSLESLPIHHHTRPLFIHPIILKVCQAASFRDYSTNRHGIKCLASPWQQRLGLTNRWEDEDILTLFARIPSRSESKYLSLECWAKCSEPKEGRTLKMGPESVKRQQGAESRIGMSCYLEVCSI